MGNGVDAEITHGGQSAAHKKIMDQANIKDAQSQGCLGSLKRAQSCSASVEAIAQPGNWPLNRLSTHYLSAVEAGVALHMAGFNPPNERLCPLRNKVIPPLTLQRLVFPFIEDQFPGDEDWRAWIENIMLDRDVFYGRGPRPPQAEKGPVRHCGRQSTSTTGDVSHASDDQDDADKSDNSDHDDNSSYNNESGDGIDDDEQEHIVAKRRHLILLAHLRKVVLQDAAVLMDLGNQDEQCRYHQHRVFDQAVFQTQLFIDFRVQLHAVIHTAATPISNNPAVASAPDIHTQLQSLESRVIDLSRRVETIRDNNRSARESHDRAVQTVTATIEETLSADLDDIRRQIQMLRQESALNIDVLKRVMNQIAVHVGTIITEEFSQPSPQQQQLVWEEETPEPGLDIDVDLTMDLCQEAFAAHATSVATVPQPNEQQESVSSQGGASVATQLASSSNSMSVDWVPESEAPPSPPSGRTPPSLQHKEMLMSMIWATATRPVKPSEMPAYSMLPRNSSVDALWQEWLYGVNGSPSLLQLNEWYGTSWRRGSSKTMSNANAVLYLFKKNIIHAVLQSFPHDRERPLKEREAEALLWARERIESVGSINFFAKSLPKKAPKRKPKGKMLLPSGSPPSIPQEADDDEA